MRNITVTPHYEFPVSATYNMLDVVYEEITTWKYYHYKGSFPTGDYANLDSVDKIFHFVDDYYGGNYHNIVDKEIVKEWICRHKIASAINEIVSEFGYLFSVEVEATMKFLPRTGSSISKDGETYWQSVGEVAMTAPMSQFQIDDKEFIESARSLGADTLAEAYADYIEHYID